MLTLSKKLKKDDESPPNPKRPKKVSIRDRLLIGEVAELENNLNSTCKINFPDPNRLHEFFVEISPDEGLWRRGTFKFFVQVPENYNIQPPTVKCRTKIYHPNITEAGDVCLSLLRDHSLDGTGWLPTRTLKDVVWGLSSLFTDLCDFDDPLNVEAANHYHRDQKNFVQKVEYYVHRYAMR